jgi:rhodanese-related sulfurtransferase
MKHSRSGKILIQMAAIIGIGFAIGVVDAYVTRPIDLSKRAAPKDIKDILSPGAGNTKPEQQPPGSGHGEPVVNPKPDPGATLPTPPADNHGATAAPVGTDEKPFIPTPKDALPAGQVTLEEAKQAFDAGAMFVDARNPEHYKGGHVENAIRIESAMFKSGDPAELALMPRSAIVIVYCNGGQCDESENVAKFLTASGYKTVYVLHDGFPGWKAMGYPSATGE